MIMMRSIGLALAMAVCVSAAPGAASAQQSLVERGRQIAEANCSRCHAIGREGESRLPIAPPLRNLPSRYPVEELAEAFAEGIVTAHPEMPQFTFEPQEIEALLAYIDSLGAAKAK
jgi:mono/diheme cytochrome c family protein